ncbi:hypothetical protein OXT66_07865 [Lentilactobacillus senioris]|uniref:hypothetical protein n=1 Tax=Lentilactobacillus senioris TaxID=931534 RepID=UPI00227EAEC1|nr:hypothetical protein [Lentilactobacillus senioris]MCY9807448.1 hypothetical protein [Lentilactobacillus senioris]
MSKYNETILTKAGRETAIKAANGKTNFTITRVVSSADDLSGLTEAELLELTAIPSEVQEATITDEDESGNDSIIGTVLTFFNRNQDYELDESYYINTIGLYATLEGSTEEFLYALTTAIEPEFIPDYKDNVVFNFELTVYVIVGQKANVTVNIDPAGWATKEYVDKAIESHKVILPDTLAYTDKAETINETWNFIKGLTKNGVEVATAGDIQNLVDQIAALQKLVGDLVKIVPISQTEYDALVAAGTIDTTAMYITWEG